MNYTEHLQAEFYTKYTLNPLCEHEVTWLPDHWLRS